MKLIKYLLYYLIVLLISIVLGFIGWLFLFIVNTFLEVLWIGDENGLGILYNSPIYILLFCLIGASILAMMQSKTGVFPKKPKYYLEKRAKDERIEYKYLPLIFLYVMFPLILGTSAGAEAALVGIYFMASVLVMDILNIIEKKLKIKIITYETNKFIKRLKKNKKHLLQIVILYIGTLISLSFFGQFDEFPPFYVRFGTAIITVKEILLLVPLVVIGYLLVLFYKKVNKLIDLFYKTIKSDFTKTIIGGLFIAVGAIFFPLIILSGEGTLNIIYEDLVVYSAITLIVLAVLKMILTQAAMSSNIKGGNIFPVTYISIFLAYGFAMILNIDPIFVSMIFSLIFLKDLFNNLIASYVYALFFFPIKSLTIIAVVIYIFEKYIIPWIKSIKFKKII